MKFFIKKIFDGEIDEFVRRQFQKFGKGKYEDRALLKLKKVKDRFNISAGSEYANEFVRHMGDLLGEERTNVRGVIISTRNLEEELEFKDKKQFMGIKKYIIEKEMSGNEIKTLCDKFLKPFISLSFKVKDGELKIKEKPPKSGKPGGKGQKKPKPDFCKLKTNNLEIVKNLVFEIDNFKEVEINHTFLIEEIIIPKDEKDPIRMRELAKRKGKIIRKLFIDGKERIEEKEFLI
jgi:hypothetical protein